MLARLAECIVGAQSFIMGQLLPCGFQTERHDVGAAVFWGGLAGLPLRLFTLSHGGPTRNGSSQVGCCPSSGVSSMPMGHYISLPAVSGALASSPRSLIATRSDLCISMGIVAPSSCGVVPCCSAQRVVAA